LIRHSIFYFIMHASNGVLAFAALAVFTRLLRLEEYGAYTLGIAVATVASGVLFQWLNVAISRFYPLHLGNSSKVVGVVSYGFWLATVVAASIFIGLFPFLAVFGVDSIEGFVLFLIAIVLGRHNLSLQMANAESSPTRYGLIFLGQRWLCTNGRLHFRVFGGWRKRPASSLFDGTFVGGSHFRSISAAEISVL